jgi:molybdate transport system substrate-binding protein
MRASRLRVLASIAFAVAATLAFASAEVAAAGITIYAAASLKEALDEQAKQFEAASGTKVVAVYAGSNTLAKQIEAGAPADVFIAADLDWADYLDARKLLRAGSRVNLLGNELVLIAPATSTSALRIAPSFPLAAALDGGKLAMANPDSVPAGRYGKEALEALGVWPAVERQAVRAENVRAALSFVARGEAPFGIVYKTDAIADKRVRIVDVFPSGTHPAIVYPAAVVISSKASVAAAALLQFLRSDAARAIWTRHGFAPL